MSGRLQARNGRGAQVGLRFNFTPELHFTNDFIDLVKRVRAGLPWGDPTKVGGLGGLARHFGSQAARVRGTLSSGQSSNRTAICLEIPLSCMVTP